MVFRYRQYIRQTESEYLLHLYLLRTWYSVYTYLREVRFVHFDTSQSQSHITTDDQSVSAHDQMLITVWQLLFCRYRAPPLTRGRAISSAIYRIVTPASFFFLLESGRFSISDKGLIVIPAWFNSVLRYWHSSTPDMVLMLQLLGFLWHVI
jgi:hypothetical protein